MQSLYECSAWLLGSEGHLCKEMWSCDRVNTSEHASLHTNSPERSIPPRPGRLTKRPRRCGSFYTDGGSSELAPTRVQREYTDAFSAAQLHLALYCFSLMRFKGLSGGTTNIRIAGVSFWVGIWLLRGANNWTGRHSNWGSSRTKFSRSPPR